MKSMKENAIQEYILSVDFNEDWSVKIIKRDLKRILGEEPAIDINYQKDAMINEITGEAKEVKKLHSISIVFTDLDDDFKRVEYLV